jgi:HD-GYP domain-containing protein (c-di-GMP phosphodiesterase class II)
VNILKDLTKLSHILPGVRHHHESYDGSGYPDRLSGEEIPFEARILAVADSFDAMTTERPYRARLSVGLALQELVRLTPEKYDPRALQALLIQIRRDAVGSNRVPILEPELLNVSPTDVDQLASTLQHRITQARTYLT